MKSNCLDLKSLFFGSKQARKTWVTLDRDSSTLDFNIKTLCEPKNKENIQPESTEKPIITNNSQPLNLQQGNQY